MAGVIHFIRLSGEAILNTSGTCVHCKGPSRGLVYTVIKYKLDRLYNNELTLTELQLSVSHESRSYYVY